MKKDAKGISRRSFLKAAPAIGVSAVSATYHQDANAAPLRVPRAEYGREKKPFEIHVISLDGFVSTIVIGVIIGAARPGSGVVLSSVLVVVLGGFVGTAILARFMERRGG